MPSPPMSPVTIVQQDLSIDQLSLDSAPWKPHYLTTLKPVSPDAKISATAQMVTFHPQFLDQHLGGQAW